jgi:hypothetical protein
VRNPTLFEPDRRLGVVFHIFAILLLVGISGWGIWQASRSAIGPTFLVFLSPLLFAFILVPLVAYRLYSLLGAYYHLERDGMRLRWGLRIEDIPIHSVIWIRLDSELDRKLPMPWLRWPGSVLGQRTTAEGNRVEFMASRSNRLVVLATEYTIYAISPAQPEKFLGLFQSFMELGSLSPLPARSIYPAFLLSRVWRQRMARFFILTGLALNMILLVWVSLVIPERAEIYLSFSSTSDPVPAVRLLLIPVISSFFFLLDVFLGLFFFRRSVDPPSVEIEQYAADGILLSADDAEFLGRVSRTLWKLRREFTLVPEQYLAHLLWGSGTLVSALFILATYFILGNSG